MKHASIFTGIGGFDLGFELAGIDTVLQVENNEKCIRILEQRWPNIRRIKDVNDVVAADLDGADVVSGGFPCQDVSSAGKRAGLAGERSGLWFEFQRIIEEAEPPIVVIENVPGLLNSNGGRDFGLIIGALAEIGYFVAWRILNSRYFGVPQNRRRVFIVGSYRTRSAEQILLNTNSRGGDVTKGAEAGAKNTKGNGGDLEKCSGAVTTAWARPRGGPVGSEHKKLVADAAPTITTALSTSPYNHPRNETKRVVVSRAVLSKWQKQCGGPTGDEVSNLTTTTSNPRGVRETPGLPRGMDAPRYEQLGNAVTATVAFWLGKRIMMFA